MTDRWRGGRMFAVRFWRSVDYRTDSFLTAFGVQTEPFFIETCTYPWSSQEAANSAAAAILSSLRNTRTEGQNGNGIGNYNQSQATLHSSQCVAVDVRTAAGWRAAPPSLVTSLDGRPLSTDMQPSQRAPTEWERPRRRARGRRRALGSRRRPETPTEQKRSSQSTSNCNALQATGLISPNRFEKLKYL